MVQHLSILQDEQVLKKVFSLYVVGFDEENEAFKTHKRQPGAYFREFKKAYYQMMFDKKWAEEIIEIEHQHLMTTALILFLAP